MSLPQTTTLTSYIDSHLDIISQENVVLDGDACAGPKTPRRTGHRLGGFLLNSGESLSPLSAEKLPFGD
jgi:hypothetical protein